VHQLTVLYSQPEDRAKFDQYYDEVHTPLARKIPGLQRLTVTRPTPGPDGAEPPYHLIATLEFADEASFASALGSPEGQAAAGDLANFAQAGAAMLAGPATSF
jgi:uncharacterized protein (TIGR02118 family)